jgi:hypothetical protein
MDKIEDDPRPFDPGEPRCIARRRQPSWHHEIHQVAACPFAHRARIVLEEKNVRYDVAH